MPKAKTMLTATSSTLEFHCTEPKFSKSMPFCVWKIYLDGQKLGDIVYNRHEPVYDPEDGKPLRFTVDLNGPLYNFRTLEEAKQWVAEQVHP